MSKGVERERERGHRKARTPYHESKKKTTRFDGPTHQHIPYKHTTYASHDILMSLPSLPMHMKSIVQK